MSCNNICFSRCVLPLITCLNDLAKLKILIFFNFYLVELNFKKENNLIQFFFQIFPRFQNISFLYSSSLYLFDLILFSAVFILFNNISRRCFTLSLNNIFSSTGSSDWEQHSRLVVSFLFGFVGFSQVETNLF